MPITVLIADDSHLLRSVLRADLESEGFDVYLAEDGPAAVKSCRVVRPDVLVLDMMMPGLDGWQVADQLAADDDLRHIPIVFLSGSPDGRAMRAAHLAGLQSYVRKPYRLQSLLAEIDAAVHPEPVTTLPA